MIRRLILGAALAGAVLGAPAVEAMPLGAPVASVVNSTGAQVEKVVVIIRRARRPVRVIRRRPAIIVR